MSEPPVTTTANTVALPGHVVDLVRHALLDAAGERIELRPQALDLLCLLARHAGETVDKRHLMEQVWPGLIVTDDSLVQAVSDIRRAIGDEGHRVVQTVPRRGYRLIAVAPAPSAGTAPAAPPAPVSAFTDESRRSEVTRLRLPRWLAWHSPWVGFWAGEPAGSLVN